MEMVKHRTENKTKGWKGTVRLRIGLERVVGRAVSGFGTLWIK